MKKTDYKGKTKPRSLINTILYRVKLEMPNHKIGKSDINGLVNISRIFWKEVLKDRVFLRESLVWDTPKGKILNFKNWINQLNKEIYDLVENNYETISTRLTSYDAYKRMRDVIEILATYGLNYEIFNLSEKLHKVNIRIIPKDRSQLNYLMYKNFNEKTELHNLIYEEFYNPRYEVKGVHLSLPTDDDYEKQIKIIETGSIKNIIRAEENEDIANSYFLSRQYYNVPPWMVILSEILGNYEFKKSNNELNIIRQFLYDMDLAIIYIVSKNNKIDILLFKLKLNHYAELPKLTSFELDAPPASHFLFEETNVIEELDEKNRNHKEIIEKFAKQITDDRKKMMEEMEKAIRGR